MNLRRIPLLPTLIVLAAVVVMLRLGFWQLDRLQQKHAMIDRYASALRNPQVVRLATLPVGGALHYRHVTATCRGVTGLAAKAGRNASGGAGWAHIARCVLAGGAAAPTIDVVLGWSADPRAVTWSGGAVSGILAPAGETGLRIVAAPPLAGLAANANPDPNDIPNNHLAYAVQWFLFATTALVIYGLALRKRLAATGERG